MSCSCKDLLDGLEEIGSGHDVLVVGCSLARSGRTTAVPASSSSLPTMTATCAPLRSAAFIWLFMLRLS